MITRKQIAHDLAAVLSPRGEADWWRYLALARAVETRLDRQFQMVMHPPAGISPHLPPAYENERKAAGRPQYGKEN